VALAAQGLDLSGQQMGQRWAVGCVALEITQRCNLDCTAWHLSEHSDVHAGYFAEMSMLAAFFKQHSNIVCTASFQLQAASGRGLLADRPAVITQSSVIVALEAGVAAKLGFGVSHIDQPECTVYALCWVLQDRVINLLEDAGLVHALQAATAKVEFARGGRLRTAQRALWSLAQHPGLLMRSGIWWIGKLTELAPALARAPGRTSTLSFVIHEFMDATCLQCDRIKACAFKVMTATGPVSMCMHNAKRDELILQSVPMRTNAMEVFWQPLSG